MRYTLLMNDTTTKGHTMETITIPISAIQSSIEYFADEAERYEKDGWTEMAQWALGRLSAYRSLLEVWNTPSA